MLAVPTPSLQDCLRFDSRQYIPSEFPDHHDLFFSSPHYNFLYTPSLSSCVGRCLLAHIFVTMRTSQLTFAFLSTFTLADAAAYHKPGLYKRDLTPPANTTNGYQYLGCFVYGILLGLGVEYDRH